MHVPIHRLIRVESCAVIVTFCPVLLSADPAAGGPIIPVSQERSASAMTIVPPCQGQDFDSAQAADFAPFSVAIDAITGCAFAEAIACSAHFSEIGSFELTAWSNTVASAVSAVQTVIHSIPGTSFEVTFQIDSIVEYRVDGNLSAEGAAPVVLAQARVRLSDAQGAAIHEQVVEPGPGGDEVTQEVDFFGVLEPGVYTLESSAIAAIDSTVPPQGFGSALAGIALHAAIPGDINDDDAVNVDDLLDVIGGWGACPKAQQPPCPADIAPLGGDGHVNVDDLLKVINNWG